MNLSERLNTFFFQNLYAAMFLFNVHGDRENKNTNLGFIKSISLHFCRCL